MTIEIYINGDVQTVPAGQTIAELLAALSVTERHVAVEVNRELVPKAQHARHVLAEGDQVEVVTLVGGG